MSQSYIRIVCADDTDPKYNRLQLYSNSQQEIKLHPGENILRIEDYPDLKYGFYNSSIDDEDDGEYIEASENCQGIVEIDLRHFDGSEMTTMSSMFYYMFNLERIYLTGLDTSNVTDMRDAFIGVGEDCWRGTENRCISSDSVGDKTLKELEKETGFFIFRGIKNFILTGLNIEKVNSFETMFASGGSILSDAIFDPVYRLSFDEWKIKDKNAIEGIFYGVNFLISMTLRGCAKETQEAFTEEWLATQESKIIK